MAPRLQRALLLYQQSRYDLAERELRQELATDPNDATVHALLALCLTESERRDEATREAREAVGLAPDQPFTHYALARVLHDRERLDEAATAIGEALRLDPEDPDYLARLAAIRLDQRRWKEALDAAERGLRVDPEHAASANLRAMALTQLGRRDEAGATIEGALARDPENAATHANEGWRLLHGGANAPALEHFREALRIDPTLDWARTGLVEALKARSPIYGLLLRFFLWSSRLDRRVQWGLAIGGVLTFRFLRVLERANPALGPLITPILVVYVLFVLSTWLADPLFTLLLRLNRDGRLAVSREEIISSNWVGGSIAAALLMLVAYFLTQQTALLVGAFMFGFLTLSVVGVFQCEPGWPRKTMAAYTASVAALTVIGVATFLAFPSLDPTDPTGSPGFGFSTLAFLGAVLGTWLAKALAVVRPKR